MIPKIIHYCWISDEKNMPDDIKQCIESWHKYLPDYKFINWNDTNFDWNICKFTEICRKNNKYAFCSDYIRFWSLYNYGGIYLDSDVLVKKSFDDLLNLDRIITKEVQYTENDYIETAIIGSKKNDEVIKIILDYYNNINITEKYKKYKLIVSPHIASKLIKNKYKIEVINEILNNDNKSILYVLNVNKFFNLDSKDAYAQHLYKNSWFKTNNNLNCLSSGDYKIFLCAHKKIENYIPKNKNYVIITQTKNVDNSYNDNFHNIIDISDDDFTKKHWRCYGEGCAMRYLWKHPDIIPEYIYFAHYRRLFEEFIGKEKFIPRYVNHYGAIINTPLNHIITHKINNRLAMYINHHKSDVDNYVMSVKTAALEYWESFNKLLFDHYQYTYNCFIMKKENFLEMCEMCFRVLDYFDKTYGYDNNDKVILKESIEYYSNTNDCINKTQYDYNILQYSRLQGFFLEWLTELYYRHKFGINNCYKSPIVNMETDYKKML